MRRAVAPALVAALVGATAACGGSPPAPHRTPSKQVRSSTAPRPAACAPAQVVLRETASRSGPDLVITVRPHDDSGACSLSLALSLTLETPDGLSQLDVEGNGATATLSGRLPSPIAVSWRWSNWCGAAPPFRADASGSGGQLRAGLTLVRGPACGDRGSASRLLAEAR